MAIHAHLRLADTDREFGIGGHRILIVGINYEPETSGIAPYTTAAAKHLAAAGNDVLVLAGVPHYPQWKVTDEFRWKLRVEERSAGVQVRRLRHFVPGKQSAWSRGLYEATFGVHVFAQQLPWRPDLVLAAVPSILGAAAAVRAAHHHHAPLGVWVQDLMGEAAAQSGITGGGPAAKLVSTIERWLLLQATGVAVISDSFRSHVERIGIPAERVHQLPNWSHVEAPKNAPSLTRTRLDWPNDTIVALHTGNMGLKQGLENVIEAARLAEQRGEPIRFVLMGDGSQRRALEALCGGLSTVEFLPPVPLEEYADTLAAADVLVINERVGVHDMSLPSKLTSYFIAGRPVVAAVDLEGATAREIALSGGGLTVRGGRPELLLAAVIRLAANRDLARLLGSRGKTYAESRLNKGEALNRLRSFAQVLIANEQTRHSSRKNSLPRY